MIGNCPKLSAFKNHCPKNIENSEINRIKEKQTYKWEASSKHYCSSFSIYTSILSCNLITRCLG